MAGWSPLQVTYWVKIGGSSPIKSQATLRPNKVSACFCLAPSTILWLNPKIPNHSAQPRYQWRCLHNCGFGYAPGQFWMSLPTFQWEEKPWKFVLKKKTKDLGWFGNGDVYESKYMWYGTQYIRFCKNKLRKRKDMRILTTYCSIPFAYLQYVTESTSTGWSANVDHILKYFTPQTTHVHVWNVLTYCKNHLSGKLDPKPSWRT